MAKQWVYLEKKEQNIYNAGSIFILKIGNESLK